MNKLNIWAFIFATIVLALLTISIGITLDQNKPVEQHPIEVYVAPTIVIPNSCELAVVICEGEDNPFTEQAEPVDMPNPTPYQLS